MAAAISWSPSKELRKIELCKHLPMSQGSVERISLLFVTENQTLAEHSVRYQKAAPDFLK